MKVTLQTFGGLASIRWPDRVFDSAVLSGSERSELLALVDKAIVSPPDIESKARSSRDALNYKVTIVNGDKTTTLRFSDTDISPDCARLLEWLQAHSDK